MTTGPDHPDYDVVVVGGSAAGLRTAALLAAAGLRTALFERQATLGSPRRTWIVTAEIAPIMGFVPAEAIVHRTGVMELTAGGTTKRVHLAPADLIVERAVMIPFLARQAEDAGVEIHSLGAVQEIRPRSGGLEVAFGPNGSGNTRRVRTRHLVGADGARSFVARELAVTQPPVVPVVQARVRLPANHDPDVTRVWFSPERTRFFYWLIPDSPTTAVAGLIAERATHSRPLLDAFLEECRLSPLEYQGAMIPLYRFGQQRERSFDGARVLLVGDAAGDVKVTTVGGLVSGLWGAGAAARSLLHGTRYDVERRSLDRELRLHALLRWALHRFATHDYRRLLLALNAPLRDLLARRNRDTMAGGGAWRLLLAQPRLAWVASRALVRSSGGATPPPRPHPSVATEQPD